MKKQSIPPFSQLLDKKKQKVSMTAGTDTNDKAAIHPHELSADRDLEALLANELTALSLNDRNKILEDIHCVKSLTVTETPRLVENALETLRLEISCLVGAGDGNVYVDALVMDSPYVRNRDFCLRFLRADFFHVKLAAKRMLNHLEILCNFFGPVALQRHLRYSDLTKEEQDCIRKGPIQILPSRDKAGRLVLVYHGALEHVTPFQGVCHIFFSHVELW